MRLLSILLVVFSISLTAAVNDNPDVKGAERLFEAWMRGQLSSRGLPGVAVGVVHNQELVWARGFGYADVENKVPMTPKTKFRMASHSKLFTATSIMQLQEAGKIRLDDPVSKYLPWFQIKPAEPEDPPITIEELLTHSSGLPREAGSHWSDYKFPDADGLKKFIKENDVTYSPEVRWKYSNLAFSIAGQIVEALSGQAWAAYIQANIFDPLGMQSSSVDKNVEGLTKGYGRRKPDGTRDLMPFVDARAMGAATGITSNVEDMAKFVGLQFRKGKSGGSQILSTGSLREMHRVRVLENNWTRGNAIGFAVSRERDKVYIGHGGGYPGNMTQTLIQLDDQVGVIVLTNSADGAPADIASQLMQTVGEAVAKAGATPPQPIRWDPSWSRFSGLYRSGGFGETEVVELNRRLVMITPYGPTATTQIRLTPLGDGRFRAESPVGGSAVGEVVRFEESGGKVTRMYFGGSFSERVATVAQ